ncbi:MAG TPA: T9SS type A sorting domain-containing protein, partial [Bacteroidetes bacterium]|nr:T9SS type A sorting domain-containing protein [Bacteroidota bacterium]
LADFSVELPFLDLGGNYAVDFYADFNGNGVYDAPPTDHAWREIVADVAGDETLTFSHNTNFTDIKWKQLLTFDFTGMTPHLGQKLEIRVRDRKRVGKEVGRFSMGAIMLADFSVELPFLDLGGNYAVDFYADFNGNGVYDAPPTDHAWREIVADVAGDETLTFSHNTNFTDIKWKQMLTMDFTGMTPHVGQKLEIRVREKNRTGKEVGRFSMASIMLPDFSVDLPYLELGKSYMVDFYADFNGNGVYDAPPTDHAWREMVNDVAGDESLSFGHNTNFTDVKWKHLLTFDFTGMTPHVGQQLEIRVRDVNQVGREVGRFTMPAIMLADFTVELPYLDLGRTYFVDFFADFNGNGTYDAPPADHAWRETVAEAAGDESLAFGHNTNFTDIGSSHMLTVDFTGMNPHLGQLLELRVTEAASGKEVERYRGMIGVTEFKVELPGIQNGVEYNVDFYADFNGNGLYDAPPMDHAWRETFTAGSGNETIAFAHNTNFTDVEWVYEMTLAATGMNPHLGQLFELRVVDTGTNAEVGKFSMPSVMVPFFFVRVPGLLVGENYNVDFYADFNGNGTYDAPPTDHAWRVNLDDDEGDELVEFGHNTDFVDIMFTTDVKDIAGLQNLQVFPNPFSGAINMNLDMEAATDLSISLYNSVGQQVKTLWQGAVSAGTNTLSFEDLGALDKGVYFLKMQSGDGGTVTTVMIK